MLALGVMRAAADSVPSHPLISSAIKRPAPDLSNLTWDGFLFRNLIPGTLGNIVGGAVMVGAVYWFVYLRK